MPELLVEPDAPSDAELISAVRTGDADAYGVLFTRHRAAAEKMAAQLVRGTDVDDLVSESFAKVFSQLSGGAGPDIAFRAYLLTAVRRLHVDRVRAASRVHPSDEVETLDTAVEFGDPALERFESTATAKAFGSLPERWQLVLWHLDVEGAKPADIAPLLGMSPNSVSALAYRAREGLRRAYLQHHLADTGEESCRWTTEHLGAYVRNGLAKRDSAKVGDHLEGCRRCTAVYLELAEVNSSLAGILAPALLGSAATGYLAAGSGKAAVLGLPWLAAAFGRVRDWVTGSAPQAVAVAAGVVGVAVAGSLVYAATDDEPQSSQSAQSAGQESGSESQDSGPQDSGPQGSGPQGSGPHNDSPPQNEPQAPRNENDAPAPRPQQQAPPPQGPAEPSPGEQAPTEEPREPAPPPDNNDGSQPDRPEHDQSAPAQRDNPDPTPSPSPSTPTPSTPTPPTNLQATVTDDGVQLTWEASNSGVVDGYEIYRAEVQTSATAPALYRPTTSSLALTSVAPTAQPAGEKLTDDGPVTKTQYVDGEAEPDTTYVYRVVAVGEDGKRSEASKRDRVTVPVQAKLRSKLGSGLCVGVDSRELETVSCDDAPVWTFGDNHEIRLDEMCITHYAVGATVRLQPCGDDTPGQHWKRRQSSDGGFTVESLEQSTAAVARVLDVRHAQAEKDVDIILFADHGGDNQLFTLIDP